MNRSRARWVSKIKTNAGRFTNEKQWEMRIWQFIYQCNKYQICIWLKLQITDDLYICEFSLHIFKIFICEFFLTYIWIETYLCVHWQCFCLSNHIYIQFPKYICESFFMHLFLSVCIYPLWDCSGSISEQKTLWNPVINFGMQSGFIVNLNKLRLTWVQEPTLDIKHQKKHTIGLL